MFKRVDTQAGKKAGRIFMYRDRLTNIHVSDVQVMMSPAELKQALPISDHTLEFVMKTRSEIADIIHGRDHRLLVVCGPCSIHDPAQALEYGKKLAALKFLL